MRLKTFRITNFRSINDSGVIDLAQITALLGRNESGKSNLLRALHSLNPAEGFKPLNPIKDFPRHRRLEECKDDTPVVESTWELDADEQAELVGILPTAKNVKQVTLDRYYTGKHWTITLLGLAQHAVNDAEVRAKIKKITPAVMAAADKLDEGPKAQLAAAATAFEKALAMLPDRTQWAGNALKGIAELRKALAAADAELTEKQDQLVTEVDDLASGITGDRDAHTAARKWIAERLPKFIYLDEYPELHGHQHMGEYLDRKKQGKPTDADRAFDKLCKVAGLDPQKLQSLLDNDEQETRNQLANRAGAVVTSEIKRLWKDRALKIRFNLDAHHLDTFISDPNATYDVEVNLDERSRGFQWFFAFYIAFAADTAGGTAENAILLLDEPGLYLHAKSQSDLLRHFEDDFGNQILYTTHSPFMVPTSALDSVRTVNIAEDVGTTVSNNPIGDSRTLFPLQAALGYNLAQSLFVGSQNLVVEGVTDYWMLSAVSDYLAESGRTGLDPDLTVTPAGGAQRVPYMVALLSSEELHVLVLLDQEKESLGTRDDIIKSKLIAEQNVVFVTEGFTTAVPNEADIEDLLDPALYEALVRESYAKDLVGKNFAPNVSIPRIAKRMEIAIEQLGLKFNKTRPAKLFIDKMARDPSTVLSASAAERFERLFTVINKRLAKQLARGAKPFR
jgi:predicted ATPase